MQIRTSETEPAREPYRREDMQAAGPGRPAERPVRPASNRVRASRAAARRKRRMMLIGGAAFCIFLLGFLFGWLLRSAFLPTENGNTGNTGGEASPDENALPTARPDWITEKFLPLNEYSRPGDALEQVNGIVVHYVGNPGTTASQNNHYFSSLAETGETYASSHFLVGLEGEILQNIPLDEIAYCSGERNSDTISIECCHPDSEGKFNDATYSSLVKLVKWLMALYDLKPEQVLRHYDVMGKECPRYYVTHPEAWEQFLRDIA